jgi:hypothetical protein
MAITHAHSDATSSSLHPYVLIVSDLVWLKSLRISDGRKKWYTREYLIGGKNDIQGRGYETGAYYKN